MHSLIEWSVVAAALLTATLIGFWALETLTKLNEIPWYSTAAYGIGTFCILVVGDKMKSGKKLIYPHTLTTFAIFAPSALAISWLYFQSVSIFDGDMKKVGWFGLLAMLGLLALCYRTQKKREK